MTSTAMPTTASTAGASREPGHGPRETAGPVATRIEETNALEHATAAADIRTEVSRGVDGWLRLVEAHDHGDGPVPVASSGAREDER